MQSQECSRAAQRLRCPLRYSLPSPHFKMLFLKLYWPAPAALLSSSQPLPWRDEGKDSNFLQLQFRAPQALATALQAALSQRLDQPTLIKRPEYIAQLMSISQGEIT